MALATSMLLQWWQKFYPAVTWDTELFDISVPSYSRANFCHTVHTVHSSVLYMTPLVMATVSMEIVVLIHRSTVHFDKLHGG